MKYLSIALALVLSLAASAATVPLVMPPLTVADQAAMRRAAERCEGYAELHLLLKSAGAAEDFRREGGCMRQVMGQASGDRANGAEWTGARFALR